MKKFWVLAVQLAFVTFSPAASAAFATLIDVVPNGESCANKGIVVDAAQVNSQSVALLRMNQTCALFAAAQPKAITVAKFSALGDIEWQFSVANPLDRTNRMTEGRAVAIRSDGRIVVASRYSLCATMLCNYTQYRAGLLELSAGGQLIYSRSWSMEADSDARDAEFHDLAVATGGNLFVAGSGTLNGVVGDQHFVAMISANGSVIWSKTLRRPNTFTYFASQLKATSSGAGLNIVAMSTLIDTISTRRLSIVALNDDGNALWQRNFEPSDNYDISTTPTGLTFLSRYDGSTGAVVITKINALGQLIGSIQVANGSQFVSSFSPSGDGLIVLPTANGFSAMFLNSSLVPTSYRAFESSFQSGTRFARRFYSSKYDGQRVLLGGEGKSESITAQPLLMSFLGAEQVSPYCDQVNTPPMPSVTTAAGVSSAGDVLVEPVVLVESTKVLSSIPPFVSQTGGLCPAPPLPVLVSTPGSLHFGDIALGSCSTRTLTISNTGNANALITSVSLSTQLTGVTLTSNGCAGATLPPTFECTLELQFCPISVGSVNVSANVAYNGGAQVVIPISGETNRIFMSGFE